jgi:enoyl-CoA hydratase/carnithine racemase
MSSPFTYTTYGYSKEDMERIARMEFKEIVYDKNWYDHTALIMINRPHRLNSYTINALRELCRAMEDAMWDDSVQVIVVTGAGDKGFCTGGDVIEYAEVYTRKPSDFYKWFDPYFRFFDLLRKCGKPVIARLNGVVAGGGNEIHLACDLSIAADHVRFIQPGPRVGMTSIGGCTQWLPITVGLRRAAWMCFLSDFLDAKTALEWGLVNQVVPYSELDDAVKKMARTLLSLSPSSLRNAKIHLNLWKEWIWALTTEHCREWFSVHVGTVETAMGMWHYFKEKRGPDYLDIGVRKFIAEKGDVHIPHGPLMKTCPKCGAKYLPESFKYCGLCGAKLE